MSKINLTIDQILVLEGCHAEPRRRVRVVLGSAVEVELARLVSEGGLSHSEVSGRALHPLSAALRSFLAQPPVRSDWGTASCPLGCTAPSLLLPALCVVEVSGDECAKPSRKSKEPSAAPLPKKNQQCAAKANLRVQHSHPWRKSLHAACCSQSRPSQAVPGEVRNVLTQEGQPLDSITRDLMESRFASSTHLPVSSRLNIDELSLGKSGDPQEMEADRLASQAEDRKEGNGHHALSDFSKVRIHLGPAADAAARAIRARAFAVGGHIVFRAGEYNPKSSDGKRLLAHELAHSLQRGSATTIRRKDSNSDVPPVDPASLKIPPDLQEPVQPIPEPADVPDVKLPELPSARHSVAKVKDAAMEAGKQQALKTAKDPKGPKDPSPKPAGGEKKDPESISDVSTGGLDLIDSELAEHEQMGIGCKAPQSR